MEGNSLPGKPYSGLPLLNWNLPTKLKTVPAGGTVVVNEVRFGQEVLSDAWLLQFADPTKAFSITYRVADLNQPAGELRPTPIMASGTSSAAAFASLMIPPTNTGTLVTNQFNANAPEMTRAAVQELTVSMPAPRREGRALVFQNAQGTVAVSALTTSVVRVRFAPAPSLGRDHSWAILEPPAGDPGATVETSAGATVLRTAALRVTMSHAPFRIAFAGADGQPLDEDDPARGMAFVAPPLALCTDNAAMIAWAGLERLRLRLTDDLDFAPRPRWPLDPAAPARGGAGVKA